MLIAKGLGASLDLGRNTNLGTGFLAQFEAAGAAHGFDGSALFLDEVVGLMPLHPAATVTDAGGVAPLAGRV